MSPHASPAGTQRGTVAAVVALVLVCALALAIAPGVASADDTLERNGSDLVVNVSEVDDPEIVIVEVTDPSEPGIVYRENATGDEEVSIDITDPDNGSVDGTDLRNATVTVTTEPAGENATTETLANGTSVALHAVAFADDRPAWVGTEGEGDNATDTLYVPLDAAGTVGLTDEATVDIDVDDSGTANVTGTVRGDGAQLTVDCDELLSEVGDSRETLDLRVSSDAGPVIDDTEIRPELRSTRDGLALWHPLFDASATYAVDARPVAESEPGYTATAAETDSGYLDLSVLSPGETEVRVWDGDGIKYVNRTGEKALAYEGPSEINATVVDDETLSFDRSLAGLAVDGAIVGTDGGATYAAIDGTVDGEGNLAVDDNITLTGGETVLLSTAAGDMAVTVKADDSTAEAGFLGGLGGGLSVLLVFLVPLFVGLGVGGIVTQFQDGAPDNVSKVALGVVGFALALMPLFAIHLLTSITVLESTLQWVGLVGVVIGAVGTPAVPTVAASRRSEVVADSGPFAAKITVTDGSELLRGDVTVHYRERGGDDRYDPVTVRGGRERVQMPGNGTWEVYARHGSARSGVETVDASGPSATLTVPVEATLTVVDAVDAEPVSDATISGEAGISGTTDRNGAVTLDPPEDASDAEIKVSHDRYLDATERVRFQQNASHTVELDRRIGRLRSSARIDGAAAGAVPLRIVPDDEFLSDRFDVETVTTDVDGEIDGREVPIGRYRVEATLADGAGAYEEAETTVTVSETGATRAAIDARFTWELDAARRDRIDRIRRDVRSMSEGGGRDGTIPRYYASVVESMLDVAESIPDAGHEFVGREVAPDDAVDGILTAADRTTNAISEAMTTKRNVDLFAACVDMPDANVRWGGSFELADLLDRIEADSTAQRSEVKQRYEAVDRVIEDRRGDLSEVAPAREVQQRAWELTREANRGPEAATTGYTSLLLLDAVEELFEHDPLRERLTRTVF